MTSGTTTHFAEASMYLLSAPEKWHRMLLREETCGRDGGVESRVRGKEGGQGEEVDGGERRRTVSEREEEKGQKMNLEREHKRKRTEREVGNDTVEARRNE